LNQRFQRFRIDLNQLVEPRRTIFEPRHVLNLRIADNSIIMGQAMVLGLIQEGVLSPFFNTSGLRVVEKALRI